MSVINTKYPNTIDGSTHKSREAKNLDTEKMSTYDFIVSKSLNTCGSETSKVGVLQALDN